MKDVTIYYTNGCIRDRSPAKEGIMRFRLATSCVAAIPFLLSAAETSYFRDVRPILNRSCTSCHQPAVKSSGLDLTTYAGFQAGGKRGPAFVSGSPKRVWR